MTVVQLHREPINRLTASSRAQLPGVRHSHLLEALARALGVSSWAALGEQLHLHPATSAAQDRAAGPVTYRHVSTEMFLERLADFGYSDLDPAFSFTALENGEDIYDDALLGYLAKRDVTGNIADSSRDIDVLLGALRAFHMPPGILPALITLIAARDPASDADSSVQSSLFKPWPLPERSSEYMQGVLDTFAGAITHLIRIPYRLDHPAADAPVSFTILAEGTTSMTYGVRYSFSEDFRLYLSRMRESGGSKPD